jgi:hypothetical protein
VKTKSVMRMTRKSFDMDSSPPSMSCFQRPLPG